MKKFLLLLILLPTIVFAGNLAGTFGVGYSLGTLEHRIRLDDITYSVHSYNLGGKCIETSGSSKIFWNLDYYMRSMFSYGTIGGQIKGRGNFFTLDMGIITKRPSYNIGFGISYWGLLGKDLRWHKEIDPNSDEEVYIVTKSQGYSLYGLIPYAFARYTKEVGRFIFNLEGKVFIMSNLRDRFNDRVTEYSYRGSQKEMKKAASGSIWVDRYLSDKYGLRLGWNYTFFNLGGRTKLYKMEDGILSDPISTHYQSANFNQNTVYISLIMID